MTNYTVTFPLINYTKGTLVLAYHNIFNVDTTDVHGNDITYGYALRLSSYNDFVKKSGDYMTGFLIGATKLSLGETSPVSLGDYSLVSGVSTCSGNHSLAFGNTTVSGDYSISSGVNNTVSGDESSAFGTSNTSSNFYTFTAGRANTASGSASIAMGIGASATRLGQIAFGDYNIPDVGDPVVTLPTDNHVMIGNGTQNATSDSFELTFEGDGWFSKDVYVGSTSGTHRDSGSKKLATEDYVNTQIGTITNALQNINTGTGV